MKITLASCQNKYCGLGQYTQNLALAFTSLGHETKVWRKDDEELPIFQAYPYRSFRKLRPYIAPYYLSRALNSTESEICQADYVDASTAAILAKKDKNLFVTIHDAIPFVYSSSKVDFKIYRYELNLTFKKAKAIFVVSEHAKKEVIKYTSISGSKVFAIHNGIDHINYFPESKKTQNEVFTIKYLGGLGVPHKNAKALIDTAKILQEKGITFKMEIGGYLPQNHVLRKYAAELKISCIDFVGFVAENEMRSFYQSADVFLFPSLLEGFGFPPLEAMACGTPAIVSDIAVLRETLGDAGIYAEPKPENYADAILTCYYNSNFLTEKRMMGIEQAKKYTWQNTANQMLEVYSNYL